MQTSMCGEIRPPAGRAANGGPSGLRRELTRFDRCVRVPLGFLWLIVLAIVAVPTILFMTLLYHLSDGFKRMQAAATVRGGSHSGEAGGQDD